MAVQNIKLTEKENLLWSTYYKARDMVLNCGIELKEIVDVKINTTSKRTWGWCKPINKGECIIEIADVLLNEEYKEDLLNVMIHEILHAGVGAVGHGKVWKEYADRINTVYGIQITRCNSRKNIKRDENIYKHKLICTSCGYVWKYIRSTYSVRYPQKCKCPFCKTKTIERYKGE